MVRMTTKPSLPVAVPSTPKRRGCTTDACTGCVKYVDIHQILEGLFDPKRWSTIAKINLASVEVVMLVVINLLTIWATYRT